MIATKYRNEILTKGFCSQKLHWNREWLDNKYTNEKLCDREIALLYRVKKSVIHYYFLFI